MREIVKLGIILLIITTIAAAVLAVANNATSGIIEQVQEKENNKARQEVLLSANSFMPLDEKVIDEITIENNKIKEIYIGMDEGGNLVGYTVKTVASGYGGDIEIITGISADGKLVGMKVVSHQETPGLGANATNTEFRSQFEGKSILSNITVVKSAPKDNEIQAISGATITSKSVSDGVNMAIDIFNNKLTK